MAKRSTKPSASIPPSFPKDQEIAEPTSTVTLSELVSQISALGKNWNSKVADALGISENSRSKNDKYFKIDRSDGWISFTNSSDPNADRIIRALAANYFGTSLPKMDCKKDYYGITLFMKNDIRYLFVFDPKRSVFYANPIQNLHPSISGPVSQFHIDDIKIDWNEFVKSNPDTKPYLHHLTLRD